MKARTSTAMIYGYARVSTMKQSITRQIENIKAAYPNATIITESYTGTKMDRPEWSKLEPKLSAGDTVVFDEVSRMSRNAEEGFQVYKSLYERGVNLVFLKESTLNTDNFRQTAQIATTGTDVDVILEGINKYLMILAENQIKAAFATAQHEVDFLHKRTSEGMRESGATSTRDADGNILEQGKISKAKTGKKLVTKKEKEMKAKIRKMSKDFDGTMTDVEVMDVLKLARNTYYKYKGKLKEEM